MNKDKLQSFKNGKIAVICDDLSSATRGVLVCAADQATPSVINTMIQLTGGIFYAAVSPSRAEEFSFAPMLRPQTSPVRLSTPQLSGASDCISVEARQGVTTGISAHDRSVTLQIIGEESPNPRELVSPGHIFPVQVKEGGVLQRAALPEAAVDLAILSGSSDAACFVDIVSETGGYPTFEELKDLAGKHSFAFITLSSLIEYCLIEKKTVKRIAESKLPTEHAGMLRAIVYSSILTSEEHVVLIKGEIENTPLPIPTRMHSEHLLGDVFGGVAEQNTRLNLQQSLKIIAGRECGIVVYLRKNLSAEQLFGEKLDSPFSTKNFHRIREFGTGAQILLDLGVKKIELLTASPKQVVGLEKFGIEIVSQTQLSVAS